MKTRTLRIVVRDAIALANSPFEAIKTIARDLEENGVEYCVIGGLCLATYSYLRSTEDIDLLVSKEGLRIIKEHFIGRGYTLRPGSTKNLYYIGRTTKIPIDILVEGTLEGSIVLPHPDSVKELRAGVWYLSLPKLIEFKLNAGRPNDIQDVLKLIEKNKLGEKISESIEGLARNKYLNLIHK
jgi:hypothetical protein